MGALHSPCPPSTLLHVGDFTAAFQLLPRTPCPEVGIGEEFSNKFCGFCAVLCFKPHANFWIWRH